MKDYCAWTSFDEGAFATICGNTFYFADSPLIKDNGFVYCPFCGGEIVDVTDEEVGE